MRKITEITAEVDTPVHSSLQEFITRIAEHLDTEGVIERIEYNFNADNGDWNIVVEYDDGE